MTSINWKPTYSLTPTECSMHSILLSKIIANFLTFVKNIIMLVSSAGQWTIRGKKHLNTQMWKPCYYYYYYYCCHLRPFVRDYPGELVSAEIFVHSHLCWSSIILYLLPPSAMIHNILPVQFSAWQSFCTTLFKSFVYLLIWHPPLYTWYISSSNHTQSLDSFYNTCPYQHNLFCCSAEII